MSTKETILVVDDDAAIRESVATALRSEGFAVLTAENGAAALEFLRREAGMPALVLLDLMMPVMNGWEFRARQLELPDARKIPVVVLSAGGNVEKKAQNLGAAGWLRKPVTLAALHAAVRGALAGAVTAPKAA